MNRNSEQGGKRMTGEEGFVFDMVACKLIHYFCTEHLLLVFGCPLYNSA